MRSLHRVLAAVDFSESARAAFDHALALSGRHGAELTVVQAVPTDRLSKWDYRERRGLVDRLRAAAKAAGVRFEFSVQSGDPAGVILLHANARRADLLVLGTSTRTGFDRFRFGSVAETVARGATMPVLVVPAGADNSSEPITPLKSILVAVDLGDSSAAAVERALSLAGENTRVTLVHAVPGVPMADVSRYRHRLMEPEYQRQLTLDAWRRIPAIVPARTTPKVHVRIVVGDPAAAISRVAREVEADLVVVGASRRSALGRLLFSSTAARVIRAAGVPVLTMPQEPGLMTPTSTQGQLAAAA